MKLAKKESSLHEETDVMPYQLPNVIDFADVIAVLICYHAKKKDFEVTQVRRYSNFNRTDKQIEISNDFYFLRLHVQGREIEDCAKSIFSARLVEQRIDLTPRQQFTLECYYTFSLGWQIQSMCRLDPETAFRLLRYVRIIREDSKQLENILRLEGEWSEKGEITVLEGVLPEQFSK